MTLKRHFSIFTVASMLLVQLHSGGLFTALQAVPTADAANDNFQIIEADPKYGQTWATTITCNTQSGGTKQVGGQNPMQLVNLVNAAITADNLPYSKVNVPYRRTYGGTGGGNVWNQNSGTEDLQTLNAVCKILGHKSYKKNTAQCLDQERSGRYPNGKCNFHSPGNNNLARFNGTVGGNNNNNGNTQCSDGIDNDGDGKVDALVLADDVTQNGQWVKANGLSHHTTCSQIGQQPAISPLGNQCASGENVLEEAVEVVGIGAFNQFGCWPGACVNQIIPKTQATTTRAPGGGIFCYNTAAGQKQDGDKTDRNAAVYCTGTTTTTPKTACNDGIDNDGDGKIDGADNGCVNGRDTSELQHDPECSDPDDDTEKNTPDPRAQCLEVIENQTAAGRFTIRWKAIAGVTQWEVGVWNGGTRILTKTVNRSGAANTELTYRLTASEAVDAGTYGVRVKPLNGTAQNKWCLDSDGNDKAEITTVAQCQDGTDNDNDGKVDLQDPGCANAKDNNEGNPLLTVVKTDNKDPVNAGQQFTYTIVVKNTGTEPTTGRTVQDVLPASLTFVSANFDGSYNASNHTVSWVNQNFGANVQRSFHVVVKAKNLTTQKTITNTAKVVNGPSTTETTVVKAYVAPPACNDGIDNDNDGKTDYPQDPGCSSANDDDESDDPANVTLTSVIGNGCTAVVNYTKNFTTCAHLVTTAGNQILHSKNLFCNQSGPVTVQRSDLNNLFTVGQSVKLCHGNNYNDCSSPVTITGNTTCTAKPQCNDGIDNDGDGLTDYPQDPGCSSITDDSEGNPLLTITKADNKDPVNAGEQFTYTITVKNTGTEQTTGRTISDALPTQLTFVSANNGGTYNANNNTVTWSNQNFGVNVQRNYTVVVKAKSLTTKTTITNTAKVVSGPSTTETTVVNKYNPPATACNDGIDNDGDGLTDYPQDPGCSSTTDDSEGNPLLTITKADSKDPVASGEQFTYTIVVKNTGTEPTSGRTVQDVLPATLTYVGADNGGTYTSTNHTVSWSNQNFAVNESRTFKVLVKANVLTATTTITNKAAIVNGASVTETTKVNRATQCADGIDNDGDGKVDLADSGCSNPDDDNESDDPIKPECSDGIDNDGDGYLDYSPNPGAVICIDPAPGEDPNDPRFGCFTLGDPGCSSPTDDSESAKYLTITKAKVGASIITAGESVTYKITVTNTSSHTVHNAKITDNLKVNGDVTKYANFVFNEAASSTECSLSASADRPNRVSCDALTYAPGQSRTFTLVYNTTANTMCDVQLTNQADVHSTNADSDWAMVTNTVKCSTSSSSSSSSSSSTSSSSSSSSSSTSSSSSSTSSSSSSSSTPYQCSDGIDNDGDGKTDYPYDPGCSSPTDNDESDDPTPPACSDGIDNDGDGKIDHLDPGCSGPNDDDESDDPTVPACKDGIDNDNDGLIDMYDPGCSHPDDNDESDDPTKPQCSDGIDNDNDGLVDAYDPGCSGPNDDDESDDPVTYQCNDGIDNDNDGKIDYPYDPGCSSPTDNDETNTVDHCADGIANVSLDLQATETLIQAGDTFAYNLVLTELDGCNNETINQVTLNLDNRFTATQISDNGTSTNNTVTWTNLSIPTTGEVLSVQVQSNDNITDNTVVRATAIAGTATDDVLVTVRNGDTQPPECTSDLDISMSDSADPAEPGETIIYRATVRNRADCDITTDIYGFFNDNELRFIDASDGGDEYDDGEILWEDITIDAGDSEVLTAELRIDTDVDDGDTVQFKVVIQPTDGGYFEEIERTDVEEDGTGNDDVSVQTSANRNEVQPGSQVTYTVTVCNDGNNDLEDLEVRDSLDRNLILLDAGSGRRDGNGIRWDISSLDADECEVFTYRAEVRGSHGQTVSNNVDVYDEDGDRIASDSTSVRIIQYLPVTGSKFDNDFSKADAFTVLRASTSTPNSDLPFVLWSTIVTMGMSMGSVLGRKFL